jgi:hypothetical protein
MDLQTYLNMKWFSLTLLLACSGVFGQNSMNDNFLKKVTLPSPNAAELGKYGDVPIGLFTGAMSYSVPIFEFKTQNLSLPVSVSYSSNGVKVDQRASNVGINWALNCGGVITRSIMGRDDLKEGQLDAPPTGIVDGTSYTNPTEETKLFLENDVRFKNHQPDVYYYNFSNYSGKFVFDYDNKVYAIPHNNLKIESLVNSSNNNYHSFLVTAPDGVKYYFEKFELTNETPYNCTDPYFTPTPRETAWYLTKILHPFGDYINFGYTDLTYTDTASISQTISARDLSSFSPNPPCPTGTCGGTGISINTCYNASIVNACILSSVTSNTGSRIDFINGNRPDIAGNQLHSKVNIYSQNNTLVRAVEFSYLYSTNQRFFLSKMDVLAPENKIVNSYGFEYQGYDLLPDRLTFGQDNYGYFNGSTSNTYFVNDDMGVLSSQQQLQSNRKSDGSKSIYGMLSKITYPTGGSSIIEYESHKLASFVDVPVYYNGGTSIATNGGPNMYDAITVDGIFSVPANANPFGNPIVATIKIDAVYRTTPAPDPYNRRVIYKLINLSDNSTVYTGGINNTPIDGSILSYASGSPTANSISYEATLQRGISYKLIITAENSDLYGYGNISFSYTTGTTNHQEVIADYGGARVKKLTSISGTGLATVKNYFYNSIEGINTSSSGTSGRAVMNFTTGQQIKTRQICTNGGVGDCICCSYTCLRNQVSSSLFQVNLGSNHIYYQSVIESEGDNFDKGGIEHTYMVTSDEPGYTAYLSEYLQGTRVVNAPISNTGYNNGNETRIRIFKKLANGTFKTIEQEDKEYIESTFNNKEIRGYMVVNHVDLICESTPAQILPLYSVVSYKVLAKWSYQKSSTKKVCDDNGNVTVTSQNYTYDNPTHCLITSSSSSNSLGENSTTNFKYPIDYTITGTLDDGAMGVKNLQDKYIINPVVEKSIYKSNVDGSNNRLINSVFTRFKKDTPFPDQVFATEYASSLTNFVPASVNNGSLTMDTRYKSKVSFNQYDAVGNLLEQQKTDDAKQSFIWGYQSQYPIAQVNNASQSEIAYTSFETAETGNWNTYTGTISSSVASPTGGKYYNLNTSPTTAKLSKTVIVGKKYKVSYWRNSATAFSITGGTVTISSGPTINGWTYHEHLVTTNTTTISISGTGGIDEVRLYPAEAQMTTYTYDPLIGVTSQTDPNNRINYYEYDVMGRLAQTKDRYRNISKKYCYSYSGQPEACSIKIYVKLDSSVRFHEEVPEWYYVHDSVHYTFKIFADAAGTIPLVLLKPLKINWHYEYHFTSQALGNYDTVMDDGSSVNAGVSSWTWPLSVLEHNTDPGFPDNQYYMVQKVLLLPSTEYIIIQ